jgi:hypothetical protein
MLLSLYTQNLFQSENTGEYRLFIYIDGCYGGSATANIPVLIEYLRTG